MVSRAQLKKRKNMVVVERRGVKQLGEDICGGREREAMRRGEESVAEREREGADSGRK